MDDGKKEQQEGEKNLAHESKQGPLLSKREFEAYLRSRMECLRLEKMHLAKKEKDQQNF